MSENSLNLVLQNKTTLTTDMANIQIKEQGKQDVAANGKHNRHTF